MMEAIKLEARKREKRWKKIQAGKSSGLSGGVLVSESNFESKTDKTHEGGGSGNVTNLMEKFGHMLKNLGQRRPFRFSRGPRSCMVVL